MRVRSAHRPSATRNASRVGIKLAVTASTRQARSLPRALDGITGREREVLTLVARGLSNVEIAGRLQLSPAIVKTHIGRLLAKLPARDRAQLVIVACETGLVIPSAP